MHVDIIATRFIRGASNSSTCVSTWLTMYKLVLAGLAGLNLMQTAAIMVAFSLTVLYEA